jgi:hypothetical protein
MLASTLHKSIDPILERITNVLSADLSYALHLTSVRYVKDRTWVHNLIGVIGCSQLYSTMNADIVVCCSCLLLSCSSVKQVQKRRPQTVELTQQFRLEFTTSAQFPLRHYKYSQVCSEFKSLASTDLFKTVVTYSLQVRASSIPSSRMPRPHAHACSSAGPLPAPSFARALSGLVLRPRLRAPLPTT